MRFAWLCAASALALSACHRPEKLAPPQPAKPQAAAPAAVGLAAAEEPALVTKINATQAAGSPAAVGGRSAPSAGPTAVARQHAAPARAAPRAPASQPSSHRARVSSATAAPAGGSDPAASARSPARGSRDFSAEYATCATAANGFTVALASCRSAELARQGARVDRAFDAVLATRSGAAKQRLVQDQHAWLGRRDVECQADASRGRASDVLFEGSCRIDMTIKRATALEHMLG